MSPPRPILPRLLLGLSFSTNAWLIAHHFAHAQASGGFVTNLVTNQAAPSGDNVTKLVTNPPANPSGAQSFSALSTPLTVPPPAAPSPAASPSATFSAYADLLAQSLETPGQHDDLTRVLARWIATDPVAASEWLDRQPDDPRYDLPVAQVANHLVATGDYRLAREWADSIRTPELRAAAIEEVLAEQYRHHQLTPASLAEAATRAGLTPDRIQGILNYSRLD